MQQPCEQSVDLLMLLNPGMTRSGALHEMARFEVGHELLRRRAATGDRQALVEYRDAQRGLARIIAQAQAKAESQLAVLCGPVEEGVPA